MKTTLTLPERVLLAERIYDLIYNATESFDERNIEYPRLSISYDADFYGSPISNTIGTDLAYLQNAILTGDPKDQLAVNMIQPVHSEDYRTINSALIWWLLLELPHDDEVFDFIRILDEVSEKEISTYAAYAELTLRITKEKNDGKA